MPLPEQIYNPKPNLGPTGTLNAKLSDPAFQQAAINKVKATQPKDPIETLILFFTKTTATLQVGEYPFAESLDMNATAALMKVINMIYNMEEAIIKS